jgi:hypothetical protein
MGQMVLVHDRSGLYGQSVLMDKSTEQAIPEELCDRVEKIQEKSKELTDLRMELGRLTQVVHGIVYACNLAEKCLADTKREIALSMGLNEGNWAIDCENKIIGLVLPVDKVTPKVV